jgi:hypothetical protein
VSKKKFAVILGEKLAAHSDVARAVQFDADGAAGPRVGYLPWFIVLPMAATLHLLTYWAVAVVVVGITDGLSVQRRALRIGWEQAKKRRHFHQ